LLENLSFAKLHTIGVSAYDLAIHPRMPSTWELPALRTVVIGSHDFVDREGRYVVDGIIPFLDAHGSKILSLDIASWCAHSKFPMEEICQRCPSLSNFTMCLLRGRYSLRTVQRWNIYVRPQSYQMRTGLSVSDSGRAARYSTKGPEIGRLSPPVTRGYSAIPFAKMFAHPGCVSCRSRGIDGRIQWARGFRCKVLDRAM
jgi:hypothetical protein